MSDTHQYTRCNWWDHEQLPCNQLVHPSRKLCRRHAIRYQLYTGPFIDGFDAGMYDAFALEHPSTTQIAIVVPLLMCHKGANP
jgi:hypothetical protein